MKERGPNLIHDTNELVTLKIAPLRTPNKKPNTLHPIRPSHQFHGHEQYILPFLNDLLDCNPSEAEQYTDFRPTEYSDEHFLPWLQHKPRMDNDYEPQKEALVTGRLHNRNMTKKSQLVY